MVKLVMLDERIRNHRTGNSKELSYYIGVSRSSLFNLFDELKELGAIIKYDKDSKSYFYQNFQGNGFKQNLERIYYCSHCSGKY